MAKRLTDRVLVFGTGASFYSLLETLWRGHTHWSMSVTGGLVLLTVYTAERRTQRPLLRPRATPSSTTRTSPGTSRWKRRP